jgi:AcrR family transcriptional regulator
MQHSSDLEQPSSPRDEAELALEQPADADAAAGLANEAGAGGDNAAGGTAERPPVGNRREIILRAAMDLFAEKGFESSSLRAIAARSGVTHATVLHYYPSKEALWRATVSKHFAELMVEVFPDDIEGTPRDKLETLLRRYHAYAARTPTTLLFLLQEAARSSERLEFLVRLLRPLFERICGLIEAGQTTGQLPAASPRSLFFMMAYSVLPVSLHHLSNQIAPGLDDITNASQLEEHTTAVVRSLLGGS